MAKTKLTTLRTLKFPRWTTRTNMYTAEYVLFLTLLAMFVGLLSSLWFSLFGSATMEITSTAGVVSQLAALLVVAPSALLMYNRVVGEESVRPKVRQRRIRAVLQAIWVIIGGVVIVGLLINIATTLLHLILGSYLASETALLTTVVPGLLAVTTLTIGQYIVVKRTSPLLAARITAWLAVLAVVLFAAHIYLVTSMDNHLEPSLYKNDRAIQRYRY